MLRDARYVEVNIPARFFFPDEPPEKSYQGILVLELVFENLDNAELVFENLDIAVIAVLKKTNTQESVRI
jgi:hypothetical protein